MKLINTFYFYPLRILGKLSVSIDLSTMLCPGTSFDPDIEIYYCCDNSWPDYANIVCIKNNSSTDVVYFQIEIVGVHKWGVEQVQTLSNFGVSTSPYAYNTICKIDIGPSETNLPCSISFNTNCL